MKILYLTWDDISNPTCGCAQRSAVLYEALKRLGDVNVIRLNRKMVHESSIAILFRKLTKVARWPFGKPSIDLSEQFLRHHISTKYDVVVCRYIMTAAITQAWKLAPCYIDIDDMPTEAFDSVEGKRLPCQLRPFGAILVRHWQYYCLLQSSGIWVVSEKDKSIISRRSLITQHRRVEILPNIARMPSANYDINHPQENFLMTVGLMSYGPNQEGVDWFMEKVWPKVRECWPDLTYAIVGGGLPEKFKTKWTEMPGVKVLGFVDDIDELYSRTLFVVAPILSGAGTCIKVIEACLHGRIVLATHTAIRGNETLKSIGGVFEFEDADSFCKILRHHLSNNLPDLQLKIAYDTNRINSVEKINDAISAVIL